jgi:diacylglycerol kinase family enzyme
VDGEHVGVLPMRVSVEPGALNLLVPPEFLRGKREAAA